MRRVIAGLVVAAMTMAGAAGATPPPGPWVQGGPPKPQQPQSAPGPAAAPAPAAPGAAPAPYYNPYPPQPAPGNQWGAPGTGYDPYAGQSQAARMIYYDNQKKSMGIGLLVEFLIPGGGGIYAENYLGGGLVLAASLVGAIIVMRGFFRCFGETSSSSGGIEMQCDPHDEFVFGLGVMVAARVAGFIVTPLSVNSYNERLRVKMGISPQFVAMPTVMSTRDGGKTFGLRLTF
jgi:hypothetical protein